MIEGEEVELKLAIDPGELAALVAAPALAETSPQERHQPSIYFDTPGMALRSAGLSLRVRQHGDRRVQTVKAGGGASAGLFARPEWEREIDGDRPVIDDGAGPLTALIPADELARVAPVFEVHVRRRLWLLERGEDLIELVVDEGEISASGRTEAICEVELELKAGSPAGLFALAHELAAAAPLRLGVLSKAERGYLVAGGAAAKPVKSVAVALTPDATAAEAFRAIAAACIRQFRLNEIVLAESGSAGALHQARVAVRRLRSAFSIFGEMLGDARFDPLRGELRWIAAALGEARNIDVLLDRSSDEPLVAALAAARERAYGDVAAALASPRCRGLFLDLAEWIAVGEWRDGKGGTARDMPVERFAAEVLDRYRRRVKRRGRKLAALDDHVRHEVRIQAKKLRYAAEFFAGLFTGKKAVRRRKAFLAALEDLQAHLGELNDAVTAPLVLAQLGLPDVALVQDEARHEALLAKAADAHAVLVDVKPFWR